MQKLKRQYRRDYVGEDIVTVRTYENSDWHDQKEFIPNQIVNQQISKQAMM